MTFQAVSVDSFIIRFSNTISLVTSKKISYYFQQIKELENIIEIVPSYTTILVTFDMFKSSYNDLQVKIESINFKFNNATPNVKRVKIPVYYGLEVGFDLQKIAQHKNISTQDIIKTHTNKVYNVFAIGFAPGFAYLGEVDDTIAMPRLKTPRKIIPKGSVAIADTQTAIYPQSSPGGWNIIGKTTFEMFDKTLPNLSPLNMGDTVQFKNISRDEFLDMGGEV